MRKGCLAAGLGGVVVLALASYMGIANSIAPLPAGDPLYVRYQSGASLDDVLGDLQKKSVIRNAGAAKLMIRLRGLPSVVKSGSFEVKPGMTLEQVMTTLQKPIRRMVRLPEGWWVARTAARLEAEKVCKGEDYLALTADPSQFKKEFPFVPENSLEGYLYPDTYDLPPLLSAKDVVRMQLRAFESKVIDVVKPPKEKLHRAVIMASIIENEAALDPERARIAGVIENRLRIGQRLEMDATVLYGIQEWRVLKPGEVRKLASPFNTYLHAGLPPGPIGAPSAKSIKAALNPESHSLIYYVARPNRGHYFSSAYADHLARIKKARQEWKEAGP